MEEGESGMPRSFLKDVRIHAFSYTGILPLITALDKERMEFLQTWMLSLYIPTLLGTIILARGIPQA